MDYLFDSMHSKPVPTIDQGISPDELGSEGLIEIGLFWHVQLAHTTLRHDATIICLTMVSVTRAQKPHDGHVTHVHDCIVNPLLLRPRADHHLLRSIFRRHYCV